MVETAGANCRAPHLFPETCFCFCDGAGFDSGKHRSSYVERTTGDLREIDSASSKIKVEGARYPERFKQLTGR
jgi:hypothetical protein